MLPFSAVASAPTRVLTNRPSPAQLPTPSSSQPLSSTTVTRAGKQAGSSAIREKKHIVTSNARYALAPRVVIPQHNPFSRRTASGGATTPTTRRTQSNALVGVNEQSRYTCRRGCPRTRPPDAGCPTGCASCHHSRSVSPPIDVASLTPVAAADIVVEEPTSADIVEQLVVGAEAAESASSQQQEQQEQAGEPATVASAASAAAPAAAGDDDARSVAGSVAAGSVCTTATGASTSLRHRHASSAAAAAALKEHDAVSIKRHTSVKDAAGAVVKVLNRLHTLIVTALRTDDSHDALNRTVKSLAVARKYVKDEDPSYELTFQVFNRRDADGAVDPDRFGFFVFKLRLGEALKTADETELNVGRSSDPNRMANAVISVILGRGQVRASLLLLLLCY